VNHALIAKIVLKDWSFQRPAILGFLGMGILALGLLSIPGQWWFAAGSILLITVLITFGALLVTSTIINERTSRTLPFLMSLPIDMRDYTTAKIIGNLLIFLVPWSMLVVASFVVITTRDSLPDGLVAYAAVILTEILVGYCLLLSVALITESQGWMSVGIVVGNLSFNAFLFYISNLPGLRAVIYGSSVVWNSTFTTLLLGELLVAALLLGFTFFVQFRKTDLT
jgi:ABC-2 type transport system permease protein